MGQLNINKIKYEKIVIWAEESVNLSNNQAQWSFGNGAAGNIGIPLLGDWEVYGFSFHANNSSAGSATSINLVDFKDTTPSILVTIPTVNQGQTNNYVFAGEITPISVPNGTVIGFTTGVETGAMSNARCAIWLRK